jgi:hypothetical protein
MLIGIHPDLTALKGTSRKTMLRHRIKKLTAYIYRLLTVETRRTKER